MAPRVIDFETVKQHLASNASRLRARRGWSQQQAADAADLDLKHLQKLEYGALNPSLRTLVRLAAAFEIPVGRLVAPTAARMRQGQPFGISAVV